MVLFNSPKKRIIASERKKYYGINTQMISILISTKIIAPYSGAHQKVKPFIIDLMHFIDCKFSFRIPQNNLI